MPEQVTITAMLKDQHAAQAFIDTFYKWAHGEQSDHFLLTRQTASGELDIDCTVARKDIDANGRLNPQWDGSKPRFVIYDSPGFDAAEEDGWRYQLTLVDRKFTDSDSLPIDSRVGGNTREEAYARAALTVQAAEAEEKCIF